MGNNVYFKREVYEIKEEVNSFSQIDGVTETLNKLILISISKKSSDIHIEVLEKEIRVRIRIDGILKVIKTMSMELGLKLINKIKVLSELDLGEKRLPQDGRFKGRYNKEEFDFRVSFIPTLFGEKCVIRILKNEIDNLNIDKLGFLFENKEQLLQSIKRKSGMILLCGPTGSGKTTTLYSLINIINNEELNIVTIEDPIEYQLKGVNQIQCKSEIGLTFSKILRSVLRQDPDVILIGEIRDKETAEIALMASLTGHLVLTTLHTRSAVLAIDRLIGFGIDPYIISSGLTLIESQRLVRKICIACLGKGCGSCNDGFLGREAVEELIIVDEHICNLINQGKSNEIEKYLKVKNHKTLIENGRKKVLEGLTTEEEIFKECFL